MSFFTDLFFILYLFSCEVSTPLNLFKKRVLVYQFCLMNVYSDFLVYEADPGRIKWGRPGRGSACSGFEVGIKGKVGGISCCRAYPRRGQPEPVP